MFLLLLLLLLSSECIMYSSFTGGQMLFWKVVLCKHAQKCLMSSLQKSKFTLEIFYHSGNTENTRWKQTETRQDCTLSVLLFIEVVKLKRQWLCVCCWKHKDHMCALYPWWILLDDSCLNDSRLCKRATLCCSPTASLACDDSPHWLQRPTSFSVSPQHGNTDCIKLQIQV